MKVIFLFILSISTVSFAARWDNCSRERSQYARQIIKTYPPLLSSNEILLPNSCPLKPMGDFFARQDDMTIINHAQNWECSECGKRFRDHHYLVNHFFRRHKTSIIDKEDIVCLADYCSILRCDVFFEEVGSIALSWRATICRDEDLSSLRPQCNDILKQCSTGSRPIDLKLADALQKVLCEPLTNCDLYWKRTEIVTDYSALGKWISVFLGLVCYFVAIGIRIVTACTVDLLCSLKPGVVVNLSIYKHKIQGKRFQNFRKLHQHISEKIRQK